MSLEVFEGVPDVRTVRKNEDAEAFDLIMKRLKFERAIDLIVFCASVGLYRSKLRGLASKETNPSLRKLVGVESFEESRLFDYIILIYLDVEKERMKEFECYFYTGFKILQEWFENNDRDMTSTLERFSTLYRDLSEKG